MPSAAALTALPCASAARPAANASANPAVMIDHFATSVGDASPPAAASCAYSGAAAAAISMNTKVTTERLLTIGILLKRRGMETTDPADYAAAGACWPCGASCP